MHCVTWDIKKSYFRIVSLGIFFLRGFSSALLGFLIGLLQSVLIMTLTMERGLLITSAYGSLSRIHPRFYSLLKELLR